MKMFFAALALFFWLVTARAQFYAPDTEYHDISQRTFPVEAARVLAWQQNHAGQKIAEVTFTVSTNAERLTLWEIQWRDAAGKVLREKEVKYPEALLTSGPEFFRNVFQQLCSDDWQPKKEIDPRPADVSLAFWEGAQQAGVSRMEAITTAGSLVSGKSQIQKGADAARLSGTLLHAALPILGVQLTLDSLTLSRSAAWLCYTEALTGQQEDSLWCPIIFLTGREKVATALWQSLPGIKLAEEDKDTPDAKRFWDFLLRKPSRTDAFLFAAKPQNRSFAMPLLIYFGHVDGDYLRVACELSDQLFGAAMIGRCHDYGPAIESEGGIEGGRMLEGQWASFARRAWIKAMSAYKPAPLDFTGYRDALANASAKTNSARHNESMEDASLLNLKEAVPLINLGYDEGDKGPLIPVACATARDLLNFGWESEGLQLGIRYNFVKYNWGVPDLAETISRISLAEINGLDPFFGEPELTPKTPLPDLLRLQFVTREVISQPLSQKPRGSWNDPQAHGSIYMRRCWLWKMINCCQIEGLTRGGASAEQIWEAIRRMEAEGGMLSDDRMLYSIQYANIRGRVRKEMEASGLWDFERKLISEVPADLGARNQRLKRDLLKPDDPASCFAYAQAAEKLGWETNQPYLYDIIAAYIQANAFESVKRFYRQVRPFQYDPVGFSNGAGPRLWTVGWLHGDKEMMQMALKDSNTGSGMAFTLFAVDALAREDYKAVGKMLEESFSRYGNNDQGDRRMREFLPLVPALKDKAHADHGKALDWFRESPSWVIGQWILAQNAKLTLEEAERFLGGPGANAQRLMLIAALRKDKDAFLDNYKKVKARDYGEMTWVLIQHLRAELLEIKPPAEQPDLMPPGTKPLAQMVMDEIRKNSP